MLGVVYIETDLLTERGNDGTELKIPLDKCFHSLSDQTLPLSSQPLKTVVIIRVSFSQLVGQADLLFLLLWLR